MLSKVLCNIRNARKAVLFYHSITKKIPSVYNYTGFRALTPTTPALLRFSIQNIPFKSHFWQAQAVTPCLCEWQEAKWISRLTVSSNIGFAKPVR